MACLSLVSTARTCNPELLQGGVKKMYIVAFADLKVPTDGTGDNVYTLTVGNIISAIGLNTAKTFVEVGSLKNTAKWDSALTKDLATGTGFYTNTITAVLGNMSNENRTFVESVQNQAVAFLIQSRTGKYYASGLDGNLELSALAAGTGGAEGELNGYTLTFTGISSQLDYLVDPTIIADLLP